MALLTIMRPILEAMSMKLFPATPRWSLCLKSAPLSIRWAHKNSIHSVRHDIYLLLPQDKIVNPWKGNFKLNSRKLLILTCFWPLNILICIKSYLQANLYCTIYQKPKFQCCYTLTQWHHPNALGAFHLVEGPMKI